MSVETGIKLCKLLKVLTETSGYNVGLTGGTLYYGGERKDIDIVFYPDPRYPNVSKKCVITSQLHLIKGLTFRFESSTRIIGTYEGYEVDLFFV